MICKILSNLFRELTNLLAKQKEYQFNWDTVYRELYVYRFGFDFLK